MLFVVPLCRYMGFGADGIGMDITLDSQPPKDPSVMVQALRDYGEVMFSTGTKPILRGQMYLLPRDEAEPLVKEGVLDIVEFQSYT